MSFSIEEICREFQVEGEYITSHPYGNGHINMTFLSIYRVGSKENKYIHQRMNPTVFPEPHKLMYNISEVTSYLKRTLQNKGFTDLHRRCLTFVATLDGDLLYKDSEGYFWRTLLFIDGASTYEVAENENIAFEGAKAFGKFQYLLSNYDGKPLFEVIEDFHNTPKRLENLKRVFDESTIKKREGVLREIDFILQREDWIDELETIFRDPEVKKRITHNDTKLNNLLIDNLTGEGICVIDLDTLMPGFVHHDFGDLIRTSTTSVPEDEEDISLVFMSMDMYKAIARGFYKGIRGNLGDQELFTLPLGAHITTLETAIRFLTDYLDGDKYFRVSKSEHNLIRCRTQLALVKSIEENFEKMKDYLYELRRR